MTADLDTMHRAVLLDPGDDVAAALSASERTHEV